MPVITKYSAQVHQQSLLVGEGSFLHSLPHPRATLRLGMASAVHVRPPGTVFTWPAQARRAVVRACRCPSSRQGPSAGDGEMKAGPHVLSSHF